MIDLSKVHDFLAKNHLFFGLSPVGLDELLRSVEVIELQADELLFQEGDPNNAMFFVLSGSVHLFSTIRGIKKQNNNLVEGNFFGEAGFFSKRSHTYSAVTNEPSILVSFNRKGFFRLANHYPVIRDNFLHLRSSDRLAADLDISWILENERIYACVRKAGVLLVLKSILPLILLISSIILIIAFFVTGIRWFIPAGIAGCAISFMWLIWNVVDWNNDHYIVTNNRVIWIEKIFLLYDSRIETNMENILAVSTETSLIDRIFGLGTILIKTYTGEIKLKFVDSPKQFTAIIEDHLSYSKAVKNKVNKAQMRKALNRKLGFEKEPPKFEQGHENWNESIPNNWFNDLFKTRSEHGNTITYHKHLFGLFRDSFKYLLGATSIFGFLVYWELASNQVMPIFGFVSLLILLLFLILAIVYQYLDWRNDIYQITADQILDIDRKPLGDDDRKTASIENILSTEYKRDGLLGLLFNFGTVYIMIGNNEFNFEDVADPASVQQDIIQRQIGLRRRKEEQKSEMDNERMAEWITLYHQTSKSRNDPAN